MGPVGEILAQKGIFSKQTFSRDFPGIVPPANLSLRIAILSWKWAVEVARLWERSTDNPRAAALLLHGDRGRQVMQGSCRRGGEKQVADGRVASLRPTLHT